MKLFKSLTILFATLLTLPVVAENGLNSPYTRFGFGQLSSMETGTSKGMGGTGIGVRNNNQINLLNPASYAAIDTLTFLLDVGMSVGNTNFSEGQSKDRVAMNSGSATFDYLAMQFRIVPRLGMTIGLTPFSNIGYNFSQTITKDYDDESQLTATNRYNGVGGLRQVTAGLGYMPFKGLSIGANISYVYGEIYHYVYNQYSDPNITSRTRMYRCDVSTYNADFGIQYQGVINKNKFTIGATYQPGHSIDDEAYVIETISVNDTIGRSTLSMPSTYGAGISYTYDDRLTIAADYSLQRYGDVTFFSQSRKNV